MRLAVTVTIRTPKAGSDTALGAHHSRKGQVSAQGPSGPQAEIYAIKQRAVPQELSTEVPHDPAIPPWTHALENRRQGLEEMPMHPRHTALFTAAERRKQPARPPVDEWANTMWTHGMESILKKERKL